MYNFPNEKAETFIIKVASCVRKLTLCLNPKRNHNIPEAVNHVLINEKQLYLSQVSP